MSNAAEIRRLVELLTPFRGLWVAVDVNWQRVLASSQDRPGCIQAVKASGYAGMPIIYRVPREEEGAPPVNAPAVPTHVDAERPAASASC